MGVLVQVMDALKDHASASGYFESVNGHEPKSPPTSKGLSAAVWLDRLEPARGQSGLAATTMRLVMQVRIYADMVQEPQDEIDPQALEACDTLMGDYTGDFTLGGLVRNVDLLGATGTPMFAQGGYVTISGRMYRIVTISVPMILNDLWNQEG